MPCTHMERRGLNQFMRRVYPHAAWSPSEFCCWTQFAEMSLARWIADHRMLRDLATLPERVGDAVRRALAEAGDRRDWNECDRIESTRPDSHDTPESLETT